VIQKGARVQGNDPNLPEIFISMRADIKPAFQLRPFDRLVISTPVGNTYVQVLTLTNVQPEPVEIVGVHHDLNPELRIEVVPVEQGRVYQLRAVMEAQTPGKSTGHIILDLKGGRVPNLELMGYVHVWERAQQGRKPEKTG